MISSSHKVVVVVDREFGEKLSALAPGIPVWIVDTHANRPVVERLWKERQEPYMTGITIFNDSSTLSPEELLASELDTIELHHGPDSWEPQYTVLEVIGTPLTDTVKTELGTRGFNKFTVDKVSFCAVRP